LYGYRESFMAMLDRILADHPDVTIQMDETNDYRLFPFEALVRRTPWYQNGSPNPMEALHADYVLAPFVPPFRARPQCAVRRPPRNYSADYQMRCAAVATSLSSTAWTQIPGRSGTGGAQVDRLLQAASRRSRGVHLSALDQDR